MGGGLNACREVEVCHLLLEFGFGMRGHCKTISVMGFWVGGTEGRGGGSRSVCQKSGQERRELEGNYNWAWKSRVKNDMVYWQAEGSSGLVSIVDEIHLATRLDTLTPSSS